MRYLQCALLILFLALSLTPNAPAQTIDKWLEDVSGARAMAWVKAENERSPQVLEKDPRFASLEAAALKVLESPDRLAVPHLSGNDVHNTWKDAAHPRGTLRITSIADYLTAEPHWRTVLDYDALGKQDHGKWVEKGLDCLYPDDDMHPIAFAAGGEDAMTRREQRILQRFCLNIKLPHGDLVRRKNYMP